MGDSIKVAVRLRKLIDREIASKAEIQWEVKDKTVCPVNSSSSCYSYDQVFDSHANNEVVYDEICAPIVESVITGFNGTIFAYGQTSSGKTYTLMGDGIELGIAHLTVTDIFKRIQNMEDREFLLRVSFMEIYNKGKKDQVIDLLRMSGEGLKLQDDQYGNVKILNLTETEVQEPDQVLELLRKGQKRRKTGETALNQKSSRSHLIFRMIIESRLRGDENAAVNVSHFNIVDLAGSEKPSDNTSGTRFKEGVNINKSLLELSQVISQLSLEKESQFVNYRASKLTRILKNSLGGNALTVIICNITPASYEETLSTLKFALNAKKIKNKPRVNEIETEETLIKSYANKIKKLTKQLEAIKEEKNQEARKRSDMQDQIESLKKKFVQFVPQNSITKATRRETWGGCLDMQRMRNHFQPSRILPLADIDEENEMTADAPETERTFNGDIFRQRMSTISNRLSSVSSLYSIDSTIDEYCKKEDAAVQTDLLQEDNFCSELNSKNDDLQLYKEKITNLEKELSELKLFTTLEKQLMFEERESGTKVRSKSLDLSIFSPALNKSRKSNVSNLSVGEESFGVINSLVDRKSQASRNVLDSDQEMFFQNLDIIVEKISGILKVKAMEPSITNPYFKVIYKLASIIFLKNFDSGKEKIDGQIKEMFILLNKIFVVFGDHLDSTEQNSDLIIHFDEIAEKLLKDIQEMLANCIDLPDHSSSIEKNDDAIPDAVIDNIINNSFRKEAEKKPVLPSECHCHISVLEETIKGHLEKINLLESDSELIKKQLTMSEDKIKIQQQVISSLEKEMELKVKDCTELRDNFTQTSYMSCLNESISESSNRRSMQKGIDSSEGLKTRQLSCPNCLKFQSSSVEGNAPDPVISVIKGELCDIKLLTQRMMEESMPKCLSDDVSANDSSDSSSVDFLKSELAALKNMLHKIRFYFKDRSEWSKQLENQMVDKMFEISSLQKQCSSTENLLNEKQNQLNQLHADLHSFRKEMSERKVSIRTLSTSLKCLDRDEIELVDDVAYLRRSMQELADAVVDRHTTLEDLRRRHASKESKITQTVDNYPDLAALEEIRAHEYRERADLYQKNVSLKLKVEELLRKVEDLEEELKLKEDKAAGMQKIFDEEMAETVSHHKELERKFKETMQKHIKDIEDKYEEELKNQEKSLFDMMEEKLVSQREEQKLKKQDLEQHYESVISQLNEKCAALKSEFKNRIEEEVDNRKKIELKLEAEIKDFKNQEQNAKSAYYKMKDKFREYVAGVQYMRNAKNKSVIEKGTQTNSDNQCTVSCSECRTLKHEQKDLNACIALKKSEITSLENKNRNMMKEIADLKRDLVGKITLLQTCNCRLFAKPQELVREVPHKTKNADAIEACGDQLREKAVHNPKEILKLDFVQKAIDEAREAERAIFNSGEGPASQEMCFLLRRKLAKKDKEISELKSIVSQKQIKAAAFKNHTENLNCENKPIHPIDAEVLENFTPCVKSGNKFGDDAVLKIHPKKILHEVNKPQDADVPRNKWGMTEEESAKAKELDEKLRKYGREPDCKQQ